VSDGFDLSDVESEVRSELDAKYAAREVALEHARPIIRGSANAIRAMHRNEPETARGLLADVRARIVDAEAALEGQPDIYHAGFFYDAVKEYAEAEITMALLLGRPLPLPSDLSLDAVPYLKGLGEAVGEQRRRLLDQLRTGDLEAAEATFGDMEQIHDLLTSLDYPDGMTSGLRRTTDVARSLIERSRADLTSTIVQERLRRELAGDTDADPGR
jgi:translin